MINELAAATQAQVTAEIVAAAVREAATATATAVRETAIAAVNVKSNEDSTALIAIAELKTKMVYLEGQINNFESTFKEIFEELKELSKGRPSWAVTILITLLSSLCVGMGTFIATHQW